MTLFHKVKKKKCYQTYILIVYIDFYLQNKTYLKIESSDLHVLIILIHGVLWEETYP